MSALTCTTGTTACATGQRTLTLTSAGTTYPVTVRMCMSLVKLPASGTGVYYVSDLAFAMKTITVSATSAKACTTSTTCPTCPSGWVRVLRDLNPGTPKVGTTHTAIVACYRRANNAALTKPLVTFTASRYTTCPTGSSVALRTLTTSTPANLNTGSGITTTLYVCKKRA